MNIKMEGENEGEWMKEGESLGDGFEKWNTPLGVWLASKISDDSRHLRAFNTHKIRPKC